MFCSRYVVVYVRFTLFVRCPLMGTLRDSTFTFDFVCCLSFVVVVRCSLSRSVGVVLRCCCCCTLIVYVLLFCDCYYVTLFVVPVLPFSVYRFTSILHVLSFVCSG